jgi:hypothetical protein
MSQLEQKNWLHIPKTEQIMVNTEDNGQQNILLTRNIATHVMLTATMKPMDLPC